MKPIMYFFLGMIFVLTIGATYYTFNLKEYQEECYVYKKETYVANYSLLDYADGWHCYAPSGYWGLNCSIVTINDISSIH